MSARPEKKVQIVNLAMEKGVKGKRLNDNMVYGIDLETGGFKPGVYIIDAGSKAAKVIFSFLVEEREEFVVAEISQAKIEKWYKDEALKIEKKGLSTEDKEAAIARLDEEKGHRLAIEAVYFDTQEDESGNVKREPTLDNWGEVEKAVSAYADFLGYKASARSCIKRVFGSAFTDENGALGEDTHSFINGVMAAQCSVDNGYSEDVKPEIAAQLVAEAGLNRAKVWYQTQLTQDGKDAFAKVLNKDPGPAVVLHNGRLVSAFKPDSIRVMVGPATELSGKYPKLQNQKKVSYAECGPVNFVLWEQIQLMAAKAGPGALVIPQPGSGDPECVVVEANGTVTYRAWNKATVKKLQKDYGKTLKKPAGKGDYVELTGLDAAVDVARAELAKSDVGFREGELTGRIKGEYLDFRDMVLRAGMQPVQNATSVANASMFVTVDGVTKDGELTSDITNSQ